MTALARLDASTINRLTKVCRLFSSDTMGERAAAAATAHRLVAGCGLDWGDVIRPAPSAGAGGDRSCFGTWRDNLTLALRFPHDLTPWEKGFVASMRTRQAATPKQRASLAEIASRLRTRGRT